MDSISLSLVLWRAHKNCGHMRACGENRKKNMILVRVHTLLVQCCYLFIHFLFHRLATGQILAITHLYAIKLSITSANIEIIQCLPLERRRKKFDTIVILDDGWFLFPFFCFFHFLCLFLQSVDWVSEKLFT